LSSRLPLLLAAAAGLLAGQSRWWEREAPLRFIDLATAFGKVASLAPAEITARKTAQFYNAEHLHAMDVSGGLDDQGFFFASKMAGRQNEDYLRRYLPEAKKRGLRVFVYFDIHWFKSSFGDKHPDWQQVREDGGHITTLYGGPAATFCMNNPAFREWVFQTLRDLSAYPIDGIFYDGTSFRPDTCYCRYCQEEFQKAHGRKLPSKKRRQGKDARDLLEFQVSSQVRFLRDSRRVIKSINPDIAFYKNGGVRGGNWATGRMNRELVREQDLLGSEGGYIGREITDVPHHLWKAGLTARLLETQAPEKPRVIFSNARHGPWTFSVLPGPELRLLYADTIANGANPWFAASPPDIGRPEMGALSEMNRFVANNSAYYRGTRSEARVGLVWSDTTANFYEGSDAQMLDIEKVAARSEVGNLDGEFAGLADALQRSQTPFNVIDDVTLEQEELDRYAAIFLPNVACMNDKTAGRLKDYVRRGGNLFATFETSLYDETGERRADFALAEVFGMGHAGTVVGPNRWDYMRPRAASGLLEGWPRDLVPSPRYHVRVKLAGGEPLAHYTKPLAGSYAGIPEPSDDPALVVKQYGKGKAIYFSGDLGNALNSFRFVEFFRLIENVLREIAPSPVVVDNAPRSVEVVLRSQDQGRRLLLHLVNFTGEMTRPIRRVVPLENVRITLRTNGPVTRVHTLMRPQTLAPRGLGGGQVQFVLPRMEEYEVVVVEK
jgi:hypothetical protein